MSIVKKGPIKDIPLLKPEEMPKPKNGRPNTSLDKPMFEKLCRMQCTQKEICGFLGVSDKTLAKLVHKEYKMSYQEVVKQFQEHGKADLRMIQWRQAKKSPSMSRWLGIQYLGQEEKPSGEVSKVVIVHDDIESKLMQEETNGNS